MGGVVNAIVGVADSAIEVAKDATSQAIEFAKDAYDDYEDAGKKVAEIVGDLFVHEYELFATGHIVAYDTIIKGNSFKDSSAKRMQAIAGSVQDVYDSLFDDTLGIDDGKFLGIKGRVFTKLGVIVRDVFKDHALSSVAISFVIAVIIFTWWFPPAYGFAGAVALAAFEAGIVSSLALVTIYYATLMVVSLGISAIISGVIDIAMLAMYGDFLTGLTIEVETAKETLRLVNLAAVLDGSIFDRLAGGWMYDSQHAGGVYYDASNMAPADISVGGEFKLSPHAINTQFGYQDSILKDLAGSSNFSVLKLN